MKTRKERAKAALALLAALLCHAGAYAQMDVYANGHVAVRGTLTTSATSLSVGNKTYGSDYSVYMSAANPASGSGFNIGAEGTALATTAASTGRAIGIRGVAGNRTDGWNFGVMGVLQGSSQGAGVFGSASCSLGWPTEGCYAGFFHGDLKVTRTAKAAWANPNENIVTGTSAIQSPLSILNSLRPIKRTVMPQAELNDTLPGLRIGQIGTAHYAFCVTPTILSHPELIFQDASGKNYVSNADVLPLLVASIRQLHALLVPQGAGGKDDGDGNAANAPWMTPSAEGRLWLGGPGAFTTATVIRYDIPGGTGDAWLTVADLQGTPVRRIPLDTASDRLTLSAGGLQPGMYRITLSVHGKDTGSERVIVMEKYY